MDHDARPESETTSSATRHEAIRALLPVYAAIKARGNRPEIEYPDVADHLNGCADCRDEIDDLVDMLLPAYEGSVERAPAYPQPDLTFLRQVERGQSRVEQTRRRNDRGQVILQFSRALLESLRPPPLLGALRGKLLYSYTVAPEAGDDFDVTVEIFEENPEVETVLVRVIVEVHARSPLEQRGTTIGLRADEEVRSGTTDQVGIADFSGIPAAWLPQLEITVRTETPPSVESS